MSRGYKAGVRGGGGNIPSNGRIICDTSTFNVGDTIRVRSMTDSSKVWDKQVATTGTPVIFDVPGYDYYKICIVEDISGIPTETIATYRTVDYEQTYYISSLNDKTSIIGAKCIVDGHAEQDRYSIGDTITSKVGGVDWTWKVALINGYDSHDIILISTKLWTLSAATDNSSASSYSQFNLLQSQLDSFYNAMDDEDKAVLDNFTRQSRNSNGTSFTEYTSKVWIPNSREVQGLRNPASWGVNFPIFASQSNRIMKFNGVAASWITSDFYGGDIYMEVVDGSGIDYTINGSWNNIRATVSHGILPCIRLKAES